MDVPERLRVLALVSKGPGISPGQRFRIEQWAPHLDATHGIRVEYAPFESMELTRILYEPGRVLEKGARILRDTWRRRRDVASAGAFDAVVIYRESALLGPAFYERMLPVPFVLDFDDAIWMPSGGGANGLFARLRFPSKTADIARIASAVTVGNTHLADWARMHNDDVTVVPTTIDLDRYTVQPPRAPGASFVIVWIGSFSTLPYLEIVRRPIERLASERSVEVRIVCDRPMARPFAFATNTFVRWSAANEAADIGAGDVGIMPLSDDEFSRGKCGCKALQYMAAGRPAVASPVGVNRDIIDAGENGLLAASDEEWYRALRALADDPAARHRLARAGRGTVEEGFSAPNSAAKLAGVLRRVVVDGRRRGSPRAMASSAERMDVTGTCPENRGRR